MSERCARSVGVLVVANVDRHVDKQADCCADGCTAEHPVVGIAFGDGRFTLTAVINDPDNAAENTTNYCGGARDVMTLLQSTAV